MTVTGMGEAGSTEVALKLRALLADLLETRDVMPGRRGSLRLRGRLRVPAEEAYALAAERVQPLGYTLFFRREGEDDVVHAVPHLPQPGPSRNWISLLLFALTVLSAFWTGTAMEGWDLLRQGLPPDPLMGAPFALTLMAILLAHELAHYLAARHYGVPVSLPYFIPVPGTIFGTMGAIIRLKGPPRDRRALLAVAMAGPLAGMAVALPLLVAGLSMSEVGPLPGGPGAFLEGNSLLYAGVKRLIFGRFLPGGGLDVLLHPMAFAAWGGLFVTGLNLIPAGQLDGGHIAYTLIGERARTLTLVVTAVLLILGYFWPGWLLCAALCFLLGQFFAVPMNDITRLDRPRTLLAVLMLVLFALTFTPIPWTIT